jgi:hypothetical protein
MGFSTPSWIAQLPQGTAGGITDAAQKGALMGYDLGQKRAVRGALNGLDVNDPASINQTVGALARAGASDTATGVLSLNNARVLQQVKLPIYQAVGKQALAGLAGQSSAQTPDVASMSSDQHDHILGSLDAMDSIEKQLSAVPYGTDGAERKAMLARLAPSLHDRGMDPSAIAGFDPTDENIAKTLQDHAAVRSQIAALYPQQAPQSPDASNYGIANANLSNPLYANPLVAGVVKDMGFDTSDTLNRDVSITTPMREAEAAGVRAQNTTAGTNVANANPNTAPPPFAGAVRGMLPDGTPGWVAPPGALQGQAATANATALGTGAGGAGGEVSYRADGTPVVSPVQGAAPTAAGFHGAVSGAESGASAAATAPYELVPGLTDPNTGAPLYRSKADFAHGGVPSQGASPQQQAMNTASAQQYQADKQTVSASQAALVPMEKVLDIVSHPGVATGPGTQAMNTAQSFINANLGWLPAGLRPNAGKVANLEEARKYMVQIAGAQAAQYGPGTNEKLAVAASGNANPDISNMAIRDVMRMNIALKRAEIARVSGYHGPPEGYSDYAVNFAKTVDPRAFMWNLQSPKERQATLATIKTDPEKRAFLVGREKAEAAGY